MNYEALKKRQREERDGHHPNQLVPLIIETMLDNAQTVWSDAMYPVV
jgi:hypothetical protein